MANTSNCYLDNAATTPLSSEMKEYLVSALEAFGNPSLSHSVGVKTKRLLEEVRKNVTKFIGADSYENIHFTSSGSAGNTLGIQGYALANKCNILYSPTLHKSALKTINNLVEFYGLGAAELKVDTYGNINIEYLCQMLKTKTDNTLVVAEYANSEIGTVQDIKVISDVTHKYGGKVFVDCTGSISSIPLDVVNLNIDVATFSAHKIGALKGVGVLYKKTNIVMLPLVFGSSKQALFLASEYER